MKTIALLPLAALVIAATLAPAPAADRQITVYTGAGGISVPASALAVPQPTRRAATDVAPAREDSRIVLASPYGANN